MARLLWRDDVVTQLAQPLYPSDQHCEVVDPERVPNMREGDWFYLTLLDPASSYKETVKVTAIDGPDIALERAVGEGELPLFFAANSYVQLRVCSNLLEDIYQYAKQALDIGSLSSDRFSTIESSIGDLRDALSVHEHNSVYAFKQHEHRLASEVATGFTRLATVEEADNGVRRDVALSPYQLQRRLDNTQLNGYPATENSPGVAQIATHAEVVEGTDTQHFVTPSSLAHRLEQFSGGIPTMIQPHSLAQGGFDWTTFQLASVLPPEAKVGIFFAHARMGNADSATYVRSKTGEPEIPVGRYGGDNGVYDSGSTYFIFPLSETRSIDIKTTNSKILELVGWI